MSNRGPRSPLQYAAFEGRAPGQSHFLLDIVIVLNRYKLFLLSLVIVLLGTACGGEVKKKDDPDPDNEVKTCNDTATDKFLCLKNAVQPAGLATACTDGPEQALLCGREKFLNEGYGGFVYPQPVMKFLNDLHGRYVDYYYNRTGVLPGFRHFGEYFGLIYSDAADKFTLPSDIDQNLLPVGIVKGGTVTTGPLANTVYNSETCALCHFGVASDGFYRFGIPNTHLKYGGLKLAMNRFVCYAQGTGEFADLATRCAATVDLNDLGAAEKSQCEAYQAFITSGGNFTMLQNIWRNDAIVSPATRTQMLSELAASVGADDACTAVGEMMPAYSYAQTVELSKWDGVRSQGGVLNSEASRIDRFYHTVLTVDGSRRDDIDDKVHAPVKVPVLGNLVPDAAAAAQDYSGRFLASGAVSSLQHYVRLHAALVGGDVAADSVQDDTLLPLMKFLADLKLPSPTPLQTTLDSDAYKNGQALFAANCASSGCHDVNSTADEPTVAYYNTVGTDFSYALTLDPALGSNVASLTPDTLFPAGGLKPPHLQGLWLYRGFLHNGMVYSLENLFCITTKDLSFRESVYSTDDDRDGKPFNTNPFYQSGHMQTCSSSLDKKQRQDLITYLLTL